MANNLKRHFNVPFKTSEVDALAPTCLKQSHKFQSPRTADTPCSHRTPDILSGLSQEQRHLETMGKRMSYMDLGLTDSQNKELCESLGRQIKKANQRRVNNQALGQKTLKNAGNPALRQKYHEAQIVKVPIDTQIIEVPIEIEDDTRGHQASNAGSPRSPSRSLPTTPKQSANLQKLPYTAGRKQRLLKSPKTPKRAYSIDVQRFLGGKTPKSPGGISTSSHSSKTKKAPPPIKNYQPPRDIRAAQGAVRAAQGTVRAFTSPAIVAKNQVSAAHTETRLRDEDLRSEFEFPISPNSQRLLINKKMKSRLKKKVMKEVLCVILKMRKENEVLIARRQALRETKNKNTQGQQRVLGSTQQMLSSTNHSLLSERRRQAQVLHVVASSATGGVVNKRYTMHQGGSVQDEYVGFRENYR